MVLSMGSAILVYYLIEALRERQNALPAQHESIPGYDHA